MYTFRLLCIPFSDSFLRRRLIRLDILKDSRRDEKTTAQYVDVILTACEVLIARGGDRAGVVPVLERIADRDLRRRNQLFTFQVALIDFTLRAHALLERLAGRQPSLETYWVDPPEPLVGIRSGSAPNLVVFRGAPGSMASQDQDFTYASCSLNQKRFELHVDVEYQGSSGALHEICDENHATAIRATRSTPKATRNKLFMAFECKFYESIPQLAFGSRYGSWQSQATH